MREIEMLQSFAFKNQAWGACNPLREKQPVIKVHLSYILGQFMKGGWSWEERLKEWGWAGGEAESDTGS